MSPSTLRWIHLISAVIVLFSAFVISISRIFSPTYTVLIYIVLLICVLILSFNRSTYLPFLGECALPCSVLADRTPDNSTISLKVVVPPNAKVVYWASEHSDKMDVVDNPFDAYGKYDNTGVCTADRNGTAIINIREPTSYKVPLFGRILDKHVHYRYCQSRGLLSDINTVNI